MNTMLMILDGFGLNPNIKVNAIAQANTPIIDKLFQNYPNTVLGACGLDVGLPDGQMGNSEVGHLNIGAGRIVYQELTKITIEIENGSFFKNNVLLDAMNNAALPGKSLHLLGLVSDGGVHSHLNHLLALLDFAKQKGVTNVYVHALLDGRDVPPRCAQKYFDELERYMAKIDLGKVATVSGRYYGMDRDNRWERVEKAYNAISQGVGIHESASASIALSNAYTRGENDEFVLPTVITESGVPVGAVNDGDSFIMFNFRPDRAREITRCFVDHDFKGFERKKSFENLKYVCLTQYDITMPNVTVAFTPQSLANTLGEYVSDLGLTQLRIAETEKYAHVTFFFNGGVEEPNKGEDRILIPSPKVATYDLQPEMSAYLVADAVIEQIKAKKYDLIILNFANPDMVGHTGSMPAAIKAVEAVDTCVGKVVAALLSNDGQLLFTADHGNSDCMLDDEGNVVTAHSLNPVPLIALTKAPVKLKERGVLADLAPTLLDIMNIKKPDEMTGVSLIAK